MKEALSYYRSEKVDKDLDDKLGMLPNVELMAMAGWKGTEPKSKKIEVGTGRVGRIYINLAATQMYEVFYELARFLNNNPDMAHQTKVAVPAHNETRDEEIISLNRADKMLFYFNATDEQKALNIVRALYQKLGPSAFEDKIPKMAAQLRYVDGKPMEGFAFGQDPEADPRLQVSFNNTREHLLISLYKDAGISPDSPDFEKKLQERFKDYWIDPINPAFNWPPEKGQQLFPVIAANSI